MLWCSGTFSCRVFETGGMLRQSFLCAFLFEGRYTALSHQPTRALGVFYQMSLGVPCVYPAEAPSSFQRRYTMMMIYLARLVSFGSVVSKVRNPVHFFFFLDK